MQDAALTGLRQLGIAGLPWTPELRQWQARVMLMNQYAVASAEPWPDLSDTALAAPLVSVGVVTLVVACAVVNLPVSGVVAPIVILLIEPTVAGLIVTTALPVGDNVTASDADNVVNAPAAETPSP